MSTKKEKENLNPVQMFSKIGRYISERIVPIDHRKSHGNVRRHTPKVFRQHSKEKVQASEEGGVNTAPLRPLLSNRSPKQQEYQPCVGHYQVRFTALDKSV